MGDTLEGNEFPGLRIDIKVSWELGNGGQRPMCSQSLIDSNMSYNDAVAVVGDVLPRAAGETLHLFREAVEKVRKG